MMPRWCDVVKGPSTPIGPKNGSNEMTPSYKNVNSDLSPRWFFDREHTHAPDK